MSDQKPINDTVWAACEAFRGDMPWRQARDYVLVLLFLKFLSDQHHALARQYRAELGGGQEERIARKLAYSSYILPQVEVHDQTGQVVVDRFLADIYGLNIRREQPNFSTLIDVTLSALELHNKAKLGRLFHHISFNNEAWLGPPQQRNYRLKQLLAMFAYLELRNSPKAHAQLFQYLLERFAMADSKSRASHTPAATAQLVAALLRPEPGHQICDPVCGTADLLVAVAQLQGHPDCQWFGQERDTSQAGLARMHLLIHELSQIRIEPGDTLKEPLLVVSKQLLQFDIVLSYPPLPQDQWLVGRAEHDPFARYWRGAPPKSKADYAYICHLLEVTRPLSGRMAVLAPLGVLFRSGAEGRIRQRLITDNVLDAVIVLPGQILANSAMSLVLLLFDRAREAGGARAAVREVFLLDAASGRTGKQRGMLPGALTQQILAEVMNRIPQPGRSHLASIEDIAANHYDLNLPRYLRPVKAIPIPNLPGSLEEISAMEQELVQLRALQQQRLSALVACAEG